MTIRIAICDDEDYIGFQLESLLADILKQRNIEYAIEVFGSGESLCTELKNTDYDMVFLDIELPKISGVEVGKYIRDELKNEVIQIAYISAKESYAMELFEFRPINFLVKPLDEEKVAKVIDKYLIITAQNNRYFEYKKRTNFYKVPLSEIVYFESHNRKVIMYKQDATDEFYESMENVYSKVKGHDFLFIHKSIIVNYRFIKNMSYEKVILLNDVELPISQSRRSVIRSQYMKLRKREV